jgi:ABC-type transport system substrate-binding protein
VTSLCIENPEAVKKWGDVRDWHHAIGTGPWILDDFVPGVSATMIKNPNYWGHDERYPQNKLPYINRVNFSIIPDQEKPWRKCAPAESMFAIKYHRWCLT